jgi:hypothetical protein
VVLPRVTTAGVEKAQILLAWDFTTASDTYIHSHVLAMRDAALAAWGDGSGYGYTITAVEPNFGGDGTAVSRVHGTFEVPCFLTDGFAKDSVMKTDAAGMPVLNGKCNATFMVLIPTVATTATLPLRVLVYGHGLLGNALDEPSSWYLRDEANALPRVLAATDWVGLSTADVPNVVTAFSDLNQMPLVSDRLQQAILNQIFLVRLVHGKLAADSALVVNGKPVVSTDPTDTDYYGNSLGGIMGDSFMAWDPDVARGVLGVPGGDWCLQFERSADWPAASVAFPGSYPSAVDRQILLAYSQSLMDFSDPISTAADVIARPLPGVAAKQLLLQEGIHDSQVPNLATETVARTLGVPYVQPSLKPVFGLTGANGPLQSALAIYDLDLMPFPPTTNAPVTTDNGSHNTLRIEPADERQIAAFINPPYQVTYTCSGTTGCTCYAPNDTCQ